jgi:hypothetical protein
MLFEDAPSYIQKRGTLRIDLNPDGIASMGRRENIFIPWMDFVAEDSRGFGEDFNAKFRGNF